MRIVPVLVVSAVLLAGCTSHVDTGTPAPQPKDLSGEIRTPDGYEAMPNDTLSGPLDSEQDVQRFFVGHPDDASEILDEGFVAGYARFWKQIFTGSITSPDFPQRPEADTIVLRFADSRGAIAVCDYLRSTERTGGATFFAVPGSLPDGFGDYLVQPGDQQNPTTYAYSVAWVRGSTVFDVETNYFGQQANASDVIAKAVAQDRFSQ